MDDDQGIPAAGYAYTILMGEHLPPMLQTWGYTIAEGNETGYVMKFEILGQDGPETVEFWLSKDRLDALGSSIVPGPQQA